MHVMNTKTRSGRVKYETWCKILDQTELMRTRGARGCSKRESTPYLGLTKHLVNSLQIHKNSMVQQEGLKKLSCSIYVVVNLGRTGLIFLKTKIRSFRACSVKSFWPGNTE